MEEFTEGRVEHRDDNCLLHRGGDLPAIIGGGWFQSWYWHGKKHREGDNPAFIQLQRRGDTIWGKCWYWHGKRHREGDQPAIIALFDLQKGRTYRCYWFTNGQLHRDEGPAYLSFCPFKTGNHLTDCMWYCNGQRQKMADVLTRLLNKEPSGQFLSYLAYVLNPDLQQLCATYVGL